MKKDKIADYMPVDGIDSDCPDLSRDFSGKTKVKIELKHLLIPLAAIACAAILLYGGVINFGGVGKLVINEVLTNNHSSYESASLGTPDYVELYNGSSRTVNLKGYGVSDSIKNCYKYTLPDVSLAPGEYLLVFFAGGTPESEADPFCTGFGLKKEGDTVALVDDNYDLLDSVEVPALPADISYGRDGEGAWVYFLTPTPGKDNPAAGLATLDTAGMVSDSSGVVFTEISTANHGTYRDENGASPDYAELCNASDHPVRLGGCGIGTTDERRFRFILPDVTLNPGEYMIVTFDSEISGPLNAPFNLSKNGESLFLTDPAYVLLDSVTAPALPDDCSWARRTDLTWGYCKEPTPGAYNDTPIMEGY